MECKIKDKINLSGNLERIRQVDIIDYRNARILLHRFYHHEHSRCMQGDCTRPPDCPSCLGGCIKRNLFQIPSTISVFLQLSSSFLPTGQTSKDSSEKQMRCMISACIKNFLIIKPAQVLVLQTHEKRDCETGGNENQSH